MMGEHAGILAEPIGVERLQRLRHADVQPRARSASCEP